MGEVGLDAGDVETAVGHGDQVHHVNIVAVGDQEIRRGACNDYTVHVLTNTTNVSG